MNKLLIGLTIAAFGLSGAAMAETSKTSSGEHKAAATSKTSSSKSDKARNSNEPDNHKYSNRAGVNLTGDQSKTKEITSGQEPTSPAEKNAGLGGTGGKLGGIGSK